jgi:transcription elongation factor GreA-like protein
VVEVCMDNVYTLCEIIGHNATMFLHMANCPMNKYSYISLVKPFLSYWYSTLRPLEVYSSSKDMTMRLATSSRKDKTYGIFCNEKSFNHVKGQLHKTFYIRFLTKGMYLERGHHIIRDEY